MELRTGEPVPSALLDVEVEDATGAKGRLGDFVRRLTLLLFLRHYGCVHCSRQVDRLVRRLPELEQLPVDVVLIGSGPAADIRAFAERQMLEGWKLTVVSDPSLAVYRAAGLERSIAAVVGPRGILDELRAIAAGYLPRRRSGDVGQLGGALLVDEARVIRYYHRSRSPGDLADVNDILQAVMAHIVAGSAIEARV